MAHCQICQWKRCPEKTFGRVSDGQRRRDYCHRHFNMALQLEPELEIVEEWGERPEPEIPEYEYEERSAAECPDPTADQTESSELHDHTECNHQSAKSKKQSQGTTPAKRAARKKSVAKQGSQSAKVKTSEPKS